MKLPFFITYKVLGSAYTNNTECRTAEHVQHMINEIKNYTLVRFETNCESADISDLEIIGNNGKVLKTN